MKHVDVYFFESFAPRILTQTKVSTIRRDMKCVPGDEMHFYIDDDVIKDRRIGRAICQLVLPVRLSGNHVSLDGKVCSEHDAMLIAKNEGFMNLQEMLRWFEDGYDLPYKGFYHHWGDLLNDL